MVTNTTAGEGSEPVARDRELGRGWGLPRAGQKRTEIILGGHRGQAREHVLQIGVRIVAAALAAHDERVDDRRAVAGVGLANEEPVLRAEFARADGVLDRVGVERS